MEADRLFEGYTPEISRVGKAVDRAGEFLARVLSPIREAPLLTSNHYHPEHFHGAERLLDEALDLPEGIELGSE